MSKIAVIKTGGKQYKVREGQVLKVEKLELEEGNPVSFDQVLLIADADGKDLKLGMPLLEKASVKGKVVEQGRGDKIRVIKYKHKIRYKKTYGHRQHFTKVQIEKISA